MKNSRNWLGSLPSFFKDQKHKTKLKSYKGLIIINYKKNSLKKKYQKPKNF